MTTGEYVIRRMAAHEVQIAVDWANEQGWNPGLHDAQCFYAADPNGFFIGLLDGEPIATGCAVAYGDAFAFCGLYIVKKEYRGRGYGMQLTEERLKYASSRLTGLDGVLDKVEKYKRLGYVEAHRNIRFAYTGGCNFKSSAQVIDLSGVSFEQVEAFDRKYFPGPRTAFLRRWLSQPHGVSLGYVDAQGLKGYAVARKCVKGYKIGPLFAETASIAGQIFETVVSRLNEGPIFLDCPEPNKNALALVKEYGMEPQFEVIRMYRNGNPNLKLQGIYGLTTFELG